MDYIIQVSPLGGAKGGKTSAPSPALKSDAVEIFSTIFQAWSERTEDVEQRQKAALAEHEWMQDESVEKSVGGDVVNGGKTSSKVLDVHAENDQGRPNVTTQSTNAAQTSDHVDFLSNALKARASWPEDASEAHGVLYSVTHESGSQRALDDNGTLVLDNLASANGRATRQLALPSNDVLDAKSVDLDRSHVKLPNTSLLAHSQLPDRAENSLFKVDSSLVFDGLPDKISNQEGDTPKAAQKRALPHESQATTDLASQTMADNATNAADLNARETRTPIQLAEPAHCAKQLNSGPEARMLSRGDDAASDVVQHHRNAVPDSGALPSDSATGAWSNSHNSEDDPLALEISISEKLAGVWLMQSLDQETTPRAIVDSKPTDHAPKSDATTPLERLSHSNHASGVESVPLNAFHQEQVDENARLRPEFAVEKKGAESTDSQRMSQTLLQTYTAREETKFVGSLSPQRVPATPILANNSESFSQSPSRQTGSLDGIETVYFNPQGFAGIPSDYNTNEKAQFLGEIQDIKWPWAVPAAKPFDADFSRQTIQSQPQIVLGTEKLVDRSTTREPRVALSETEFLGHPERKFPSPHLNVKRHPENPQGVAVGQPTPSLVNAAFPEQPIADPTAEDRRFEGRKGQAAFEHTLSPIDREDPSRIVPRQNMLGMNSDGRPYSAKMTVTDSDAIRDALSASEADSRSASDLRPVSPLTTGGAPSIVGHSVHTGTYAQQEARLIAQQISVHITPHSNHDVDIALSLQELGHVKMRVQMAESGITLMLSADKPETQDLMRRHVDVMAREFKEMGYQDIAFNFQSSGHGSDRTQKGHHLTLSVGDTFEESTEPVARALPHVSATTGLDIRI